MKLFEQDSGLVLVNTRARAARAIVPPSGSAAPDATRLVGCRASDVTDACKRLFPCGRRRLQSPQARTHLSAPGVVGFVLERTAAVDLTAAVVAVLGGEISFSTTPGRWPGSEGQE